MIRHSVDGLLDIVYQHYPRQIARDDPRYEETSEYHLLSAARRRAGADQETWREMLRRLKGQFPSNTVQNLSLHLPTGAHDAAYVGQMYLPASPGESYHILSFMVSFLVPYYLVHSSRLIEDPENKEAPGQVTRFQITIPWDEEADAPGASHVEDWQPPKTTRRVVCFDFSPEEQTYATWIARDIEATWGYERMPPAVGKVIVPDVATNLHGLGEASLYDCLFIDD